MPTFLQLSKRWQYAGYPAVHYAWQEAGRPTQAGDDSRLSLARAAAYRQNVKNSSSFPARKPPDHHLGMGLRRRASGSA
jgi:hypothetical protein